MLIRGDARHLPLREGCVQCVVTSPPYFGLRDYGDVRQIGLEGNSQTYVKALVRVFRDVRRVMTDAATLWLNLGDTYNAYNGNAGPSSSISNGRHDAARPDLARGHGLLDHDLKPKDLLLIPARVAIALQDDGWYVRSDIVWAKPNPMPESVTDRPTKSHEYLFLLTKSERYYYNADAIREPHSAESIERMRAPLNTERHHTPNEKRVGNNMGRYLERETGWGNQGGRNKRSVWTIPTMPYAGAHFATMPEALVQPCILAGCPVGGLVLDPFLGSGTVGAVAERLGRRWVGVDLRYQDLATRRTAQRGLRFTAGEKA